MPVMSVIFNGDNAWPDLRDKDFIHLGNGAAPIQVAVLEMGMKSGRPSISIRIDLPDGQTVIAEASARSFVLAARMINAKYPGLLND